MIKEKKQDFFLSLVVVAESIFIYVLAIIGFDHFLVEKLFLIKNLTSEIRIFILVGVFLIVFLANFFSEKIFNFGKKSILFLVGAMVLSLFGNQLYKKATYGRSLLPKIYSVTDNWSIQAKRIEIKGKNFGPTWKRGKVFVENLEFNVLYWSEDLVLIEQPVPPEFFQGHLYLVTKEGQISNKINYEVKDPDFLKKAGVE